MKRHYLNTQTHKEGDELFRNIPSTARRAVLNTPDTTPAPAHLKAV